jgi:glycosyltransferase involved in cell wall biosynthesis
MRYCLQHLNDLSGSPLILRERLDAMPADEPVTLITNQTQGFLSGWTGPTVRFRYVKHDGRVLRFLSLTAWYLKAGAWLLWHLKPGDSLTASTLISSPLLALIRLRRGVDAELMVNEIFFRVPVWREIGLRMARSPRVLKTYLSRFVEQTWGFGEPSRIIYPKLRRELVALSDATPIPPKDRDCLRFFLVGSQIEAKGYRLFIEIARHFAALGARHRFHLFLAGNPDRFAADYPRESLPANLTVTFNDSSPAIFAGQDIFLGLTNTALWLETFGQTFAEAMMMGNIVIVPDKGAQLEYVEDGMSGFLFREHSVAGVLEQVDRVLVHGDLDNLAAQARRSIRSFYGLD